MKMHEQLKIAFKVIDIGENGSVLVCQYIGDLNNLNDTYRRISSIIDITEIEECEEVIEAIENAENGLPFTRLHGPDALVDDYCYDLIPPNIVGYNKKWVMPMEKWKQLMQEWKDFQLENL